MNKLPNLLSNLRIVMIPFFVWQMLSGNTLAAGVILAVSGITDTLDGRLARRFHWVSEVGKALDPLADKLTQCAVSICLLMRMPSLWFFFALLILKDMVMLTLGIFIHRSGVQIEGAGLCGKAATVVFYVVMGLIVLVPSIPEWIVTLMLAIDVAFALLAGFSYLPDCRRYLAKRRERKSMEQGLPKNESKMRP